MRKKYFLKSRMLPTSRHEKFQYLPQIGKNRNISNSMVGSLARIHFPMPMRKKIIKFRVLPTDKNKKSLYPCIFNLPVGKQRDGNFFFFYCNKKKTFLNLACGLPIRMKNTHIYLRLASIEFLKTFRSVVWGIEIFCLFIAIGKKAPYI